ncbi:putative ABC transport system substrate-binding protein [Enhydrobacter aerosaccus]|uniref:Putative ABC transport system substrate-binding protein n=1 Tax=Enhydrobacter aerosaccus TaxID=225324 RepID=A0A1T4R6E6_9HYPH|nr:ABC transporter substrate-binding protein [Enhydrobacter aerosaccus]SKA11396.1 putative ABC transport system substrate-binding protein [Enhydrobacter aerosaccus]
MKRRQAIGLMAGSAVSAAATARAQQTPRMWTVGVATGSAEGDSEAEERLEAFRQGMRDLGWSEGRNVRYVYRWMRNDAALGRTMAAELVALAPDVVLTSGTVATVALHTATDTVPVVFVNVTDPVAGGFVASLGHPGGNMTGFTPFEYEISGKWLVLLRQVAPAVSRVALMGDIGNHNFKGFWLPFEEAARRAGIEPLRMPATSAAEIESGIAAFGGTPGGGLIVTASTFSLVHRELIESLAARYRLPAIYWTRFFPQTGGLLSYGPDSNAMTREAARYVSRILEGEKPANLPVQVATKYETVLNLGVARKLGLAVPPQFAALADEVID